MFDRQRKDRNKIEIRDSLYEYKDAFSLRYQIGTSQYTSGNRCHGQDTIFYQTISCKGGKQK